MPCGSKTRPKVHSSLVAAVRCGSRPVSFLNTVRLARLFSFLLPFLSFQEKFSVCCAPGTTLWVVLKTQIPDGMSLKMVD